MPQTIQQIAGDLAQRLAAWLEQPDEAFLGLQELRERLGALRGSLGVPATSGALRELSGAERSIRASRQREAADAIAAACRELGVILEPKAPLKRAPRRKVAKPSPTPAPVAAGAVVEGTPASAHTTEPARERDGLLPRLRAAQ